MIRMITLDAEAVDSPTAEQVMEHLSQSLADWRARRAQDVSLWFEQGGVDASVVIRLAGEDQWIVNRGRA